MQAQISAIVYVFSALLLAVFLTRTAANEPWYRSALMMWFASTAVIFSFLYTREISLLLLGTLLLFLTPRPVEQKLPFCLLVFCAIPTSVAAPVPFPFINYLINADFQLLVGLLLVLPVLLSGQRPEKTKAQGMGSVDYFVYGYFIFTTLLMIRVLPFTSVIRFGAEAVLGTVLVYVLIKRVAISETVMERALQALYVATVVMACIALLSQIKHWNFYGLLAFDARIIKVAEVRYGIMRTSTTMIPVLFGFLEALGIILLLRQKDITGRLPSFGRLIGLLLVMGVIVSMSRGAWLASVVSMGSYLLLRSRLSSSNIVLILAVSSAFLVFSLLSADSFSTDLDPFGSFNYRKELFIASWDQFQAAPFIGDPFYLESGRFDELIQGESIVDVVSVYLQIVLQFGLIGLLLYVMPFLIALGGVLRLRNFSTEMDQQTRTLIAALGAFLLGYLVMIFTVSTTSLVIHYGVIFVGLANAAVIGVNLRIVAHRNQVFQQKLA